MKYRVRCAAVLAASLALVAGAAASGSGAVSATNAWVRATVPGQSVAGAYMDVTAPTPRSLVGASSPVASRAELHTMTMDGAVMRMRALERLDLPARKTVNLKPGGHHVMLIGIKRPLKAGERVPITLMMQDAHGAKSTLQVEAEVRVESAQRSPRH